MQKVKKKKMHLFGGGSKPDKAASAADVRTSYHKSRKRGIFLNILLVVCLCVFLYSGYTLVSALIERKESRDEIAAIQSENLPPSDYEDENIRSSPRPTAVLTQTPDTEQTQQATDDAGGIVTDVPKSTKTPPTLPTEEATPDVNDGSGVVENPAPKDGWQKVNFESLLSENPDFKAWLTIPGTNINYPVVWRANDLNNEYYLKHTFYGVENKLGAIFIEGANNPDFTDRHTIIYGHNIKNHSMFWTLTQYRSQSFYNAHPIAYLMTPYGNYKIEIFASWDAKPGSDNSWQLFNNSTSDEAYLDWLWDQANHSYISTNVLLSAKERYVTLSTCSYVFDNARFVVIGRLVETDEGDYRSDDYYYSHPRPAVPWLIQQSIPDTAISASPEVTDTQSENAQNMDTETADAETAAAAAPSESPAATEAANVEQTDTEIGSPDTDVDTHT